MQNTYTHKAPESMQNLQSNVSWILNNTMNVYSNSPDRLFQLSGASEQKHAVSGLRIVENPIFHAKGSLEEDG